MKKSVELKILGVVAAFVFPPLGVLVGGGGAGAFFINLGLTFLLFYVPGLIHGLYYALRENP